jgi:hypothetical protein
VLTQLGGRKQIFPQSTLRPNGLLVLFSTCLAISAVNSLQTCESRPGERSHQFCLGQDVALHRL